MKMAQLERISLLLILLTISGLSNAVIWPCESNDDCTAASSICSTVTGLCECTDSESVFSNDNTKCLKVSLFGDKCEETVQCNHMPSGAYCNGDLGVCDCVEGHTYVRGRCRLLNGLDQPCDTDLDCFFGYDRQSVTCQNQNCACANGYYLRNGNICRRKSMEIDDACVVDRDCDELGTNVKCISLKCQHDNENGEENKNGNGNKSRNENGKGNENEKAQSDTNGNKARPITPKLNTEASTNSEATSHLSKSSKSFEESVIDSPTSPLQPPFSKLYAPKKEIEEDVATASAVLFNGINELLEHETESEDTHFERKQRLREIAVQTSLETIDLKPLRYNVASQVRNVGTTTASTSTSSRRARHYRRRRISGFRPDDEDKTFSTVSNTDDDVDENRYGSSCTENTKPCSGLAHSVCSNNICLCKLGYYHRNSKCFAELGEIAESADECEHTFDDLSKKCICQKNYFYERSLRTCRKPIQFHLSCTSNSQCSPFGAARCFDEVPRRCTCEEYAEYDAIRQMCIYKQGLGAQCQSNDGCPVEHSICSNNLCLCKEHFVQKDDICVAGIGADCKLDDECVLDNAICADTIALMRTDDDDDDDDDREKTCQCRKGFVHFKDECLKEAVNLDDECIDSEQCKPLLGTCIEKKCTCTQDQHFKFGRCEDKKAVGEACAKSGECFVEKEPENVECRNSVCQCKLGYQSDIEQRSCIRVIPSRNKSSGRPSALKIVTFLLIGSAVLITTAAIKQAYY